MRFIVVDTADARGSVAVFNDAKLLFIEAHSSDEDYSSWLLPAVKRALSSCSLSLSQLDGYAVCAGPGSFTGLRVGLTTVKAWAELYTKPIAAVSRLEALAERGLPIPERFVATFLDARRNQLFAALYAPSNAGLALAGDEAVTPLEDFVARVEGESNGQAVRWVTPDAELLDALPAWHVLEAKGHVLERVAPPFALRLGQLAYRKFRKQETTDGLSLDANYVRRSDAEVFWKGNKPAFKAQGLALADAVMAVDSKNPARNDEPPGDRIFREGRSSDQAAIREMLARANLSFGVAEKSPGANSTETGSTLVHVCQQDGAVVAVVQWRNLGEEAEILDIAVAEKHRRHGHARYLLEKFLELVRQHGIRDVFLEVRESNLAAIALYRKFGFSTPGRRPNYYRDPQEAAILLHLKIPG